MFLTSNRIFILLCMYGGVYMGNFKKIIFSMLVILVLVLIIGYGINCMGLTN